MGRRKMENIEERIAEAAAILYYEGGSAAVTIRKIAQKLGVSEGTIYSRYREPEELLKDAYFAALSHCFGPEMVGVRPYEEPDREAFEKAVAYDLDNHYNTILIAGGPISVADREKAYEQYVNPLVRSFLEKETAGKNVDAEKAFVATRMMLFAYITAMAGLAKRRFPNTEKSRETILTYLSSGYRAEMAKITK